MTASVSPSDPIKLIASNAVKEALAELVPHFEQATGHRVAIAWGGTLDIARRVSAGEVVDIVILADVLLATLLSHVSASLY